MRKWKQLLVTAGFLTVLHVIPAYAAGWQWMDTNGDNVSECYYIGDDGKALTGTTTPDGYTVNEQGAWVVDGVVQTQQEQKSQAMHNTKKTEAGAMKTSQVDSFKYWLHTPAGATDNMPMIVFLMAGGGFKEAKNEKFFSDLCSKGKSGSGAYILAPYLPDELNSGRGGMWPVIESSVVELIDAVATEYKIDRNRITIAGVSRNADGAIQIASKYPEMFAGMALIVPFHEKCPIAKWDDSWGEALKTVPAWFFVEDMVEAKQKADSALKAITDAGGQAWVEIQTGKNHGDATKGVFGDMESGKYKIYNWLASLSK